MRRAIFALVAAFTFSESTPALADELNACEREMVRAAALHDIPLGMLYAIGISESGRGGTLQPYALNIEGRPRYEPSKPAALNAFRQAKLGGAKSIDVGCMQINHYYHGERFSSVEEMLDPEKNVTYAARFLSELKEREGTWTQAIARYHAGPKNLKAQKTYVCRVIGNMVESGFGEWTSDARAYCDR